MEIPKEVMDKHLKEFEPEKVKAAKMNLFKFQDMYNRMDRRCQSMCISNPKRPMTDYCNRCQAMFVSVMDK